MEETNRLEWCEGSNTIRQMPQNYLIAFHDTKQQKWLMEPDLSADRAFVAVMTIVLMKHKCKYGTVADIFKELENLNAIRINGRNTSIGAKFFHWALIIYLGMSLSAFGLPPTEIGYWLILVPVLVLNLLKDLFKEGI